MQRIAIHGTEIGDVLHIRGDRKAVVTGVYPRGIGAHDLDGNSYLILWDGHAEWTNVDDVFQVFRRGKVFLDQPFVPTH
jgi:hypothetical protein